MADTRVPRSPSTSPAASTVSTTPAGAWLTPERVAHAEFRTGFRGLDAAEVRAFLARVASELRAVQEREADLLARLEAAEERSAAVVAPPLDLRQVTEMLGQETARVLETARDAAADIRARAEAEAEAALEAATAEAERLRSEAESVLGERTAEAEAAAAEIMADAEADAARATAAAEEEAAEVRRRAGEDADRLVADAQAMRAKAEADGNATRDAAREEGRRMVAEARAVRERILTDMARRRNVARQQLERVRAARERLLDAIDGVRQGVADVQVELSGSLVDAKLAGERAARTVDIDDIPPLRELDAEVEMAKDAGLIDLGALERATGDDDLSVVDTGEFAAVTAPEPDVDVHGDGGAAPVISVDTDAGADDGAPVGAATATAPEPEPAEATTPDPTGPVAHEEPRAEVPGAAAPSGSRPTGSPIAPVAAATVFETTRLRPARTVAADEAAVAGPALGHGAPAPVTAPEPESFAAAATGPASGGDTTAAEPGDTAGETTGEAGDRGEGGGTTMRFGSIEVVPLRSDILASLGVTATASAPAAAEVAAEPAPGEADTAAEPAARSKARTRKTKSPKKADDVFARLRAGEDEPTGVDEAPAGGRPADADAGGAGAAPGKARAKGAAVVVSGVGVTEPAPAPVAADADAGENGGEGVDGDDSGEETPPSADRIALHTRDAVLAPTIRDLSRQLKLALSDQQNELLEAGRSSDKEPATAPSAEEMTAVFVAAVRDELATAFGLGRRSIKAGDRGKVRQADVDRQATALAEAVVDALRQRLGAGADDDGDELWPVERVRSAYREVRSQRLAELVEYHVFSAYAAGQLAAAPAGAKGRWVSESCGPDCLDNALAGPVPFGDPYPTGHPAPPSFAGCRCTLVAAD